MQRAFLEAIREDPDDDAHRLIYADWLDDHGDPERAEFIRVQCELTQVSGSNERYQALRNRENDLLTRNRAAWLGPLVKVSRGLHFCRGFPEEFTVRPKVMVQYAAEFDARVPAGRVTLEGGFGDPGMKALLSSPHMGWVAGLVIKHRNLTEAALVLIAESSSLPCLTDLSVEFSQYSTASLRALVNSPHRRALRRLSLHIFADDAYRYPDSATELAGPDVTCRLHSLALTHHGIGPKGAFALAGAGHLADLRELDLMVNQIGDDGAIALARSAHLRSMSRLNLHLNRLTARSVQSLVESPLLDGVRALSLGCNAIGDKGATVLANSPRLSQLKALGLHRAAITDRGAEALAASPHLSLLTALELGVNNLTDRGSQALYASPHLKRLERISIGGMIVRDKIISQGQRRQWIKRLGKGARV